MNSEFNAQITCTTQPTDSRRLDSHVVDRSRPTAVRSLAPVRWAVAEAVITPSGSHAGCHEKNYSQTGDGCSSLHLRSPVHVHLKRQSAAWTADASKEARCPLKLSEASL